MMHDKIEIGPGIYAAGAHVRTHNVTSCVQHTPLTEHVSRQYHRHPYDQSFQATVEKEGRFMTTSVCARAPKLGGERPGAFSARPFPTPILFV